MKFKAFLATKGITDEAFKTMDVSEQAKLHMEFLDSLDSVSSKEFEDIKTQLKTLETNGATAEQLKSIEAQLKELKDANVEKANEDTNVLLKEVKERKEEIKELVKGAAGSEITLKADTLRSSITNSASQNMLPTIGQLGVKLRALYDVFRKVRLTNGNDAGKVVYHDWDEATTVRAAAMVAEGAQFPESTAKFAKYSIELKKIGDTLPVSEEFGEDEESAAAELQMFLETNVAQVEDNQIALGDGTGQNLTGLVTSAPAYTPVASGITDANIKDLARKMRTAIVKTRGSKYKPDFIAANSDVIDQYMLKKDGNNNYMFDAATGTIGGLVIVEDNNLADNTLVIGDSRFGTIYEKGGLMLSKVHVGNQAIEDMMTLKARKRLLFLIRNVDKTGFLKCTDIETALTTLATAP